MEMNLKKGFTLLELLIVVAIISILSLAVLAALGNAKNKGVVAGVQSNLHNAISQAEVFYNTNTAAPNSYTGICTQPGPVGGAKTLAELVTAAGKVVGLASYATDGIGNGIAATCNDSVSAYAVEVPLNGSTVLSPKMWCVDNTGKAKQESTSIGATTACN